MPNKSFGHAGTTSALLALGDMLPGGFFVYRAGYYDPVLMDIQMPVMNGYEATRAIRALDNGARLPILALSANARDEDKRLSREAGMNGHIAKPFDAAQLVSEINDNISKPGPEVRS